MVSLQRAKGILVEDYKLDTINSIENFLNKNTSNKDYVLFYPYHPLFYFLFDRKNPSKDSIYFVRAWRFYDDEKIIEEIKQKYVSGTEDELDGISVEFPEWRFNVRMSNTEPLLRLNVESRGDKNLMKKKLQELLDFIRR